MTSPRMLPRKRSSEFALNYAVLAPSSHNSQPWRFHLGCEEVDLFADRKRALPVVDPAHRELTMSLRRGPGAVAHRSDTGHSPRVEILPDVDQPDLLARIQLGERAETEADSILLFQAMTSRSTCRQAFRDQPVPDEVLAELERAVAAEGAWLQIVREPATRLALADLIADADRRQWSDRHFREELARWIRPINSGSRDGLPVATQDLGNLMSHAGPLVIRTFDLGKGHAAKDREIALYSPVLAVVGTEGDDARAWLAAGQALARVLLEAHTEGVAASFLNQPLEVPELRTKVAEAIGRNDFPQILLRLGYSDPAPVTPRRPLKEVLLTPAAGTHPD